MKKVILFSCLLFLFIGCGNKKTSQVDIKSEPIKETSETEKIYLAAAKIDSLITHNAVHVQYYALDTNNVVIEYKKSVGLPEKVAEIYQVFFDYNNHPICFYVTPSSESGDWSLSNKYYFDKDGKTIFYRYCLNYFNSECTEILREFQDFYFDSYFTLIDSDKYYKDINMQPIDSKNCTNPYSFKPSYQGFSNYKSIADKYKIGIK